MLIISGKHPIRGLYRNFFESFLFKFPFSHKRLQWGRKCIFINCISCNGSPQQIPFQFANEKLPHSHCKAFWAISTLPSLASLPQRCTLTMRLVQKRTLLEDFRPQVSLKLWPINSLDYRVHYKPKQSYI